MESLKFVPKNKQILLCAFNTHIAKELKEKVKIKANIATLHSLGFSALKNKFSNVMFDYEKADKIIKSNIKDWKMIPVFKQVLSLCKMSLQDSPEQISKICEIHNIDYSPFTIEEFSSLIIKMLSKCKNDISSVDYDDMIWFPFVYSLYLGRYDYIFVDEAQDLNPAQLFMIKKISTDKNRTFMFYDDRQAIYGFRCAYINYLNSVVEKMECKKLPLPISYRCPKSVVNLAKSIVPDYEEFSDAIDGEVKEIKNTDYLSHVKSDSVILSRTNAPLIKVYFDLLKANIPAKIKGKDIANNLLSFIAKMKPKNLDNLRLKVNKWEESEVTALKKEYKKYDHIVDKAQLLRNLITEHENINDLKKTIKDLFVDAEEKDIVLLSTVHSFKGGERDNIFVLKSTLNYSNSIEEQNIIYIAYTRSKKNLFLIEGNV